MVFFFFFSSFLLLFPLCEGRGEQSVAQPPPFSSPAEGGLVGRAAAGPQDHDGGLLIIAAAFPSFWLGLSHSTFRLHKHPVAAEVESCI